MIRSRFPTRQLCSPPTLRIVSERRPGALARGLWGRCQTGATARRIARMFGRFEVTVLAGAYVVIVGLVMIFLHFPGALAAVAWLVVPLVIFGVIAAALNNWSGTDL